MFLLYILLPTSHLNPHGGWLKVGLVSYRIVRRSQIVYRMAKMIEYENNSIM